MEQKTIVKVMDEEETKLVSGSGEVLHYCPTCGEQMVFAYKQEYAFPMVYACPKCHDMCAYKE